MILAHFLNLRNQGKPALPISTAIFPINSCLLHPLFNFSNGCNMVFQFPDFMDRRLGECNRAKAPGNIYCRVPGVHDRPVIFLCNTLQRFLCGNELFDFVFKIRWRQNILRGWNTARQFLLILFCQAFIASVKICQLFKGQWQRGMNTHASGDVRKVFLVFQHKSGSSRRRNLLAVVDNTITLLLNQRV